MEHRLDQTRFHHRWEIDTEPTLEIASGDVVELDLEMAGAGQITEGGLTREDAYVTCSLAGDLKLLEVVDDGMWNVGFTLPLGILHDA